MPPAAEMTKTIAGLRLHKKIMFLIIFFPIPTIPILSVLFYYFKNSIYLPPIFAGVLFFCLGLMIIAVVLKNKFESGYLWIIGPLGIIILATATKPLFAILFLSVWIVFFYIFYFYIRIDWRAKVIQMHYEGNSNWGITATLRISEMQCQKTIDDYKKVLKLYHQGKTVNEIGSDLDIPRMHVRSYLLIMDDRKKQKEVIETQ